MSNVQHLRVIVYVIAATGILAESSASSVYAQPALQVQKHQLYTFDDGSSYQGDMRNGKRAASYTLATDRAAAPDGCRR